MKTIEINLYKFEELSDEAKEKAIQSDREGQEMFLDFFTDRVEERLNAIGFQNVVIQYSLNYCQGDGLSFKADASEFISKLIKRFMPGKPKSAQLIADNCEIKCSGNEGRYCYASKHDVDVFTNVLLTNGEEPENIDTFLSSKVMPEFERIYEALCKVYEKWGYAEIGWQSSDKCITESLISSELDYTKDGTIY